jgi:hypothetical protein
MPRGNEALLYDLAHNLNGTKLDPTVLFGDLTLVPTPKGNGYTISANNNNGAVAAILFGPDKYQRVHMSSYSYLKGDVQLTGGEITLILLVNFLFSIIAWGVIAFWAVPAYQDWRSGRSSGR